MGILNTVNQLLNLAAPAFAVAVLVPVFARLMLAGKGGGPVFWAQFAINFSACLAVLLAGLWFWGQDGKMVTYLAMVLVCASSQWAMQRAWKV